MKVLLIFPFLIKVAYGQFALVSDKDGYVNIHKEAANARNIQDTLRNGHLVYCVETKGKWTSIWYYAKKKKDELDGYIYSDRLTQVNDYVNIPEISNQPNLYVLGNDSIKVTISEKKFDKSKYRFTYYKDANRVIQFINGKQYWGTDGELPKSEYNSIIIQIGARKISLPPSALENLFQPTIYSTIVHIDFSNDIVYIQASNSDGAGTYDVIWRVEKGVYKDRFIAYGW